MTRLEEAVGLAYRGNRALAERPTSAHAIQTTTFERVVAANFEQAQTLNALLTGQPSRAAEPPLFVHAATTSAPCGNCGATANQLIRRGASGPWHASCARSSCMDNAVKNVKQL